MTIPASSTSPPGQLAIPRWCSTHTPATGERRQEVLQEENGTKKMLAEREYADEEWEQRQQNREAEAHE
ncbi:hypothetical protein KSF_043140 [Reticulibacter mediterranei]|uniref:Uncharacterized protein n=1 Tax=Reticulibacter mediterranei TaxID=2778369 RepID=A0A8J3IS20_9CHLR|nr:hypothetical protein KSF_043140 [Reticulibacter mediterranei]